MQEGQSTVSKLEQFGQKRSIFPIVGSGAGENEEPVADANAKMHMRMRMQMQSQSGRDMQLVKRQHTIRVYRSCYSSTLPPFLP